MKTITIYGDQCIGFDLDGTIATFDYETWLQDNSWIGKPVPNMVKFMKNLISKGFKVKIFTARCSDETSMLHVYDWIDTHIGIELEVTNVKDFSFGAIFDDRAYNIVSNSGKFNFDEVIVEHEDGSKWEIYKNK